ncbi:VOC family protein [Streptomyces sp. NPDC101776]|uniref:VOC family protein n=1 Tax=Streptomyces sp. NPDC101776 TaxID=3366146 RepID=UPI0037FF6DC0
MPEVTEPYAPGTPCWVSLTAKDQQAALDFYRDLFGWQGEIGPAEFGGYAICTLTGKPVAGISPTMPVGDAPEPPPAWTTFLVGTDARATQDAIVAAGGSLLAPVADIGTRGRMLVAADPQGAVFGVWQPVDFPGAQVVNEPSALVWNELRTSDVSGAGAFYSTVFGVSVTPMGGTESYWTVEADGRSVGGVTTLDEEPPGTLPYWRTYFAVDDADSTVDALVKAGGNVLVPPSDLAAGRTAVVTDPQGARFAVIKATPM